MNCRLNWIETVGGWTSSYTETDWKEAGIKYAASHKKNTWIDYSCQVVTDRNAYGTTPLIVLNKWIQYGSQYTKNGVKYQRVKFRQNYDMVGFLTSISSQYISGINRYKNCTYANEAYRNLSAEMKSAVNGFIPDPNSMSIVYSDYDATKQNGEWSQYNYDRTGEKGYIKRNMKRSNLVTIAMKWDYLNPAEVKKIIQLVTPSEEDQYIKLNYWSPKTNSNESICCVNVARSMDASVRGLVKDFTLEFAQV